jgi:metal-responsive CopG/Arc/MetJ family transcriptional regulator
MFGSKKISLEKALYERIEKVAGQAGYASVQEFVVHLIEQQVKHLEEAKDEEEVRKRLEGLGYIE